MPRRKTHDEFAANLGLVSPSIKLIDNYHDCRTKVLVQCDICGYQWLSWPSDLLKGHRCPRCSRKERKTASQFRAEVAKANPNIQVIDNFVNTSTKIKVCCIVCGYSWLANPSTLLKGVGCPSCGGTKKKLHAEFVAELTHVNPDIEILGEYKNNRTKLLVRCVKCGFEWNASPHNLLDARSRCPKCTHSSTSFMEQFIVEWLSRVIGSDSVIHRDMNAIGLELDVYVPSLKLAFEPGSWHWHKDKLEIDEIKRKCCTEKGIRLITIYDNVPENELFSSTATDIVLYSFDVRVQKKSDKLADLLCEVLREQGITMDNLDLNINVDEVVNAAYKNSVKTDTETFIEKLSEKGIDVEVLGIYKSSDSRICVKCKTCGHIWSPRADTLLSGKSSCRKCGVLKNGKAHLKSHEQFVSEVNKRNPTVEVLGSYTKASERIHVKCRSCGYEWNPVANSLVRNKPSACPECGKAKMIKTRLENKIGKNK